MQDAVLFELGLGIHPESRPRNGVQASLGNQLPGYLARAVGFLFDPLESLFNLVDHVLVGRKQTQVEVPVEIVCAGVSHVDAVTFHFLGGLLGEAVALVGQPGAKADQELFLLRPFLGSLYQLHY